MSWLNEARAEFKRQKRERERIGQLVLDMNEVAGVRAVGSQTTPEKIVRRIDREFSRHALRVTPFYAGLRKSNEHKTFPECRWMFGWASDAGRSDAGARVARAIFIIIRLGEQGLLGRVRRCARCQRWLYAKFNHQRFCQKLCQLLDYQTSEEWKRRRRERYRENRTSWRATLSRKAARKRR